ncbi:MAG: hypothetical protein ACKODB_09960 [Betaproteobacteria bacterium]
MIVRPTIGVRRGLVNAGSLVEGRARSIPRETGGREGLAPREHVAAHGF